jgi:hypothetical protein
MVSLEVASEQLKLLPQVSAENCARALLSGNWTPLEQFHFVARRPPEPARVEMVLIQRRSN